MLDNNKQFVVTLVQMQSQSNIEENFIQAKQFLLESIFNHQAKLIIFPENFLCLGASDYSWVAADLVARVEEFSNLAKQYAVSLLLGSVPILANENKCFSRSILINSTGAIGGSYDKIHLFDVNISDQQGLYKESDSFEAGNTHTIIPVENRLLGLSICYDLRFPELYQKLRYDGADMIAVPSAFTNKTGQDHWEVLLRARAIETQCYVLAANQCGAHPSSKSDTVRETWGHSMIIDPWGKILCSLENSPGVCSASLDFDLLDSVRKSMNLMGHKRLKPF